MSGFSINGKHINDVFPTLKLVERSTPPPNDLPIKESVVGMQGDYDFTIALFGERLYENRELTYVFNGKETNEIMRNMNRRMLENWLLSGSYMPLYDDKETFYYYLARCVSVTLGNDNGIAKTPYTIKFDAYPFKIKIAEENSLKWDDYDITDYYQPHIFSISGSKVLKIMNIGSAGVAPKIILNAPMTIQKNNLIFNLSAGSYTVDDFRFEVGMNTFTVTGNGTISFEWRKEVI